MVPDTLPDPVAVALAFSGILEGLGIPHLVGGSLASSVHGEPRSTNDVDILADLQERDVAPFVEALGPVYYVSAPAVTQAVESGHSFNVIHIDAAVKVDVFLAGRDPFNQERLRLRQHIRVGAGPDAWLYVDTAEHSVLRKLEWYRRGGGVSERQWSDVVAILRLQANRLDPVHLDTWARFLGVSDLLEAAQAEARADA